MENKPGKPNNPVRRPVVRPVTRPMGAPRPKPVSPITPDAENAEPRIRTPKPPRPPREKSESNIDGVKIFLVILVVLFAGATAFLSYDKYKRPSQPVAEEVEEKPDPSSLQKSDIDKKVAEINKLEDSIKVIIAQKEALGQELAAEKEKISELEDLKSQIQNKELSINSLNKKLYKFKKEFQTVQDSINFLATENKRLVTENVTLAELVKSKDDSLKTMNTLKSTLTEKVALASGLKAENFVVTALTPAGKEIKAAPSYKAMIVGGLKVTFGIAENHVADHGQKDVYFRLLEPGGGILQNEQRNFIVGGKNISYTDKQTFEFNNAEHSISFLYNKTGRLNAGRYTLEFYADGNKIGSTYVTLSK